MSRQQSLSFHPLKREQLHLAGVFPPTGLIREQELSQTKRTHSCDIPSFFYCSLHLRLLWPSAFSGDQLIRFHIVSFPLTLQRLTLLTWIAVHWRRGYLLQDYDKNLQILLRVWNCSKSDIFYNICFQSLSDHKRLTLCYWTKSWNNLVTGVQYGPSPWIQ